MSIVKIVVADVVYTGVPPAKPRVRRNRNGRPKRWPV